MVVKRLAELYFFLNERRLIPFLLLSLLFCLSFHRAYYEFRHQGITMGHDSWDYHKWSNALVESGYDPGIFFNTEKIKFRGGSHTLYATFVYFVALSKTIVESDEGVKVPYIRYTAHRYKNPEEKHAFAWNFPLIYLQMFFYSFTFIFIALTLWKVTNSIISSGVACLLLWFSKTELLFWVTWVMSDITLVFFSTAVFSYLVYLLNKEKAPIVWQRLILLLLGLLALFSRPNGVVPFLIVLLAMTPLFWKKEFLQQNIGKIFISGVFLFFGVILLNSQLMLETIANTPFHDPRYVAKNWIEANAFFSKHGMVVTSAKETFHSEPKSILDMTLLQLDRFYHYYIFWPKHWTMVLERYANHYIAFYIMTILSFLRLIKSKEGSKQNATYLMSFIWIIGLGGLVAITVLDFNYRFRVSLIPIWALFSGYVFHFEVYPKIQDFVRTKGWKDKLELYFDSLSNKVGKVD